MPPLFLLCFRAEGESPAERQVDAARAAIVLDTARRAREAGFARVVVATPDPDRFAALGDACLRRTDANAAFGAVLKEVLSAERPEAVVYAGGGMPGMTAADWGQLRDRVTAGESVTNNLYSPDLVATPAVGALLILPDEAKDNQIGLHLRDATGLAVATLARSAAALLDIDTPADLLVLRLAAEAGTLALGPELSTCLEDAGLDPSRLVRAVDCLTERERQILVVGRVSSSVWEALERETAARTRVIAEERGMRGRGDASPRSILAYHLDAVGPEALADALAELADAVFLDARPLYAHLGWGASRADRFAADLGQASAVRDPALAAFVAAVGAARVPIVLGGHSLVSGGLLACIDVAWSRWEARGGSHA